MSSFFGRSAPTKLRDAARDGKLRKVQDLIRKHEFTLEDFKKARDAAQRNDQCPAALLLLLDRWISKKTPKELQSAMAVRRQRSVRQTIGRASTIANELQYTNKFEEIQRAFVTARMASEVRSLLKAYGRIDVNFSDENGMTALLNAIVHRRLDIVDLLLEHGADPNLRTQYGEPYLFVAVNTKDTRILRALLANGANVSMTLSKGAADGRARIGFRDKGNTALHAACKQGLLEEAKLLVQYGAKCCRNKVGETPLHKAAEGGNLDLVDFLLQQKETFLPLVSKQSDLGQTAVDLAIEANQSQIEGMLRWTYEDWVAEQGSDAAVQAAIEKATEVAQADAPPMTPMTPMNGSSTALESVFNLQKSESSSESETAASEMRESAEKNAAAATEAPADVAKSAATKSSENSSEKSEIDDNKSAKNESVAAAGGSKTEDTTETTETARKKDTTPLTAQPVVPLPSQLPIESDTDSEASSVRPARKITATPATPSTPRDMGMRHGSSTVVPSTYASFRSDRTQKRRKEEERELRQLRIRQQQLRRSSVSSPLPQKARTGAPEREEFFIPPMDAIEPETLVTQAGFFGFVHGVLWRQEIVLRTELPTAAEWLRISNVARRKRGQLTKRIDALVADYGKHMRLFRRLLLRARVVCRAAAHLALDASQSQVAFAAEGFDEDVFQIGRYAVVDASCMLQVQSPTVPSAQQLEKAASTDSAAQAQASLLFAQRAWNESTWHGALEAPSVAKELLQSAPDLDALYAEMFNARSVESGRLRSASVAVGDDASKRNAPSAEAIEKHIEALKHTDALALLHNLVLSEYLNLRSSLPRAHDRVSFRAMLQQRKKVLAESGISDMPNYDLLKKLWVKRGVAYWYNPAFSSCMGKASVARESGESEHMSMGGSKEDFWQHTRLLLEPIALLKFLAQMANARNRRLARLQEALDAWHREHTGGDTARAQAVSFLRTSVQLESKQVQNLLTSLPSHRVLQKAAALASENERLAQKKLAALHMDELAGVSLTVERRVSVASSAHSSASTLPSSASHMNLLQQQQQQQQQQQHETTTLGKKPMPLHLLSLPVEHWDEEHVVQWLAARGFARYADTFVQNMVNGALFVELDDEILKDDLRMSKLHRMRFMHERAMLVEAQGATGNAAGNAAK